MKTRSFSLFHTKNVSDAFTGLTDDVGIDLHLPVLLRQLESFIVALRQHQEVDG